MIAPGPRSVRFIGRAMGGRVPRAPFGLAGWSPEGEATVVQLDASAGDLSRADAVASQLPEGSTFESPTLVVVLGEAARPGGAWRRLVFRRGSPVPRAARCSALLMRGYVRIGAASDVATGQDLAWGWSS